MRNTQAKNLRVVKNPNFYTERLNKNTTMTPEAEAKFMEHIDTQVLGKILDQLETQMDNPNTWVAWENAKEMLRRYD